MDKLKISLIAGIAASIVKDLLTIIGDLFLDLHPSYLDYAYYLLFQQTMINIDINLLPSIFVQLLFGICLSIIYIYIIHEIIETKLIYFRGVIFGLSIWFIIRIFITIFRIAELKPGNVESIFYNFLIAAIYGLILEWFNKKYNHN